jgi:hypothetical protein
MIELTIKKIKSKEYSDKIELSFLLMAITCFVKTDFKLVDKQFKDFGFNLVKMMEEYSQFKIVDYEIDFIRDSLSELILNNYGFSQSELFPEKDIQMVKSKLQVDLLMIGKNFILLPAVLIKCSNVKFHFK